MNTHHASNPQEDQALSQIISVYTTWPDIKTAQDAAWHVLELRLAACANILPSGTSLYWWEGAIQQAPEVVMILKTSQACLQGLVEVIKVQHPYTVPCIVSHKVESHVQAYGEWVGGI